MTLAELKALGPGQMVLFDADGLPPLVGRVNAIDPRAVEFFWDDGTSTVLWFRHCEQLRDTRFANIRRASSRPVADSLRPLVTRPTTTHGGRA